LEDEEYVGGVTSGRMLRAGGIAGYSVYVTTRRLIGAKNRKALWKGIAGSAFGGVAGMYVGSKLSREANEGFRGNKRERFKRGNEEANIRTSRAYCNQYNNGRAG